MGAEKCPGCAGPVPAQAKFCPHCGLNLMPALNLADEHCPRCAQCGELISAEDNFCRYCGLDLKPAPGLANQELKKCPYCGKEILEAALICPTCGSEFHLHEILHGVIAFFTIIGIVFLIDLCITGLKHC